MTVQEIFARLNDAYRGVSSYQDRGVVLSHLARGKEPNEWLFQTWFARPDQFRFDFRTHHPYPPLRHHVTNHSVRSVGGRATYWQDNPHEEHTKTLSMAIAGATGISLGAAHDIPNMLMPDVVGGFRLDQLVHVECSGSELFEGMNCTAVSGDHPRGGHFRLLLGDSDWFVRKIWRQDAIGNVSEQIHRDVVANRAISAGVFTAGGSLLDAG